MITISSILLAIDDPMYPESSNEAYYIYFVDVTITGVFIMEALLKIISVGFMFNGPDSYMRQSANLLDLLVIVLSSFSFSGSQ